MSVRIEEVDRMFDDHPSLAASVDFDATDRDSKSPFFRSSASHHSAFRSEEDSDMEESTGPWSPPAWRKTASGYYKRQFSTVTPSKSRESSPQYESAGEGDPTCIPLPSSPLKMTPRASPDPLADGEGEHAPKYESLDRELSIPVQENPNNYIRFAVRAEVQHRTEPIDAAISFIRDRLELITRSRYHTTMAFLASLLIAIVLRILFRPPNAGPVPDLVKVAGLARSFEPLIYYSENGVQQIGDLQDTGVAVWDLGESVRSTNMTSAPLIVQELDDLSESLKTLSIELTKFFANVDGDVDSILIVMEWAKRELAQVSSLPLGTFTTAFDNFHGILCRIGLLENSSGMPTAVGKVFNELFGQATPQRTKATLQRTFNEFLSVLEESINSELQYSTALFALFEAIDRQFLNLQRTVIRETDQQEREEGEMLASLWTRVMGANASRLRKFEKNRMLLASVREKTIRNKHILVDHNGKLLQLKSNLEILRRKLVSPLVRSNDSSTLSIEEQIRGLDGTYMHLKSVRERQKGKVMEMIYGAGSRPHLAITRESVNEIEGR